MRLSILSSGTTSSITLSGASLSSSASACATLRGKPSSKYPFLQSDSDNLFFTISIVRSSGQRSPPSIIDFIFKPSSVPRLILSLKISPVEICGIPSSLETSAACVPFPLPGAPSKINFIYFKNPL